jgi:hypothetical protein
MRIIVHIWKRIPLYIYKIKSLSLMRRQGRNYSKKRKKKKEKRKTFIIIIE